MGRKRIPGLTKRGEVWHIDKQIRGRRVCESTGTSDLSEAEAYLARRTEQIRKTEIYGVRPQRSFTQAATKYLSEGTKRSIGRDAQDLASINPFIGSLALDQVHMGTLQPYIDHRRKEGRKSATVNRTLAVVRRVLNLAARLWRDENGKSWLETPPMIVMQNWGDKRKPYPLSWDEQHMLFSELPEQLATMALLKVNTGMREQEVCSLRWEWEEQIPTLNTSVFVIPEGIDIVKNGEERLVILNATAMSIINQQRGLHQSLVFPDEDGKQRAKMYTSSWKRARKHVADQMEQNSGTAVPFGLRSIRIHDLKHTFGRRLRSAGVSLETRKVLLGHKNGDITTHYSAPEIQELLDAVAKVEEEAAKRNNLVVLRGSSIGAGVARSKSPAKLPQNKTAPILRAV